MGKRGVNNVNLMQRDLADVSGYSKMPPIYMLGYNFCKYANVSAEIMIDRNRNFTEHKFPVDVLWMDIQWA